MFFGSSLILCERLLAFLVLHDIMRPSIKLETFLVGYVEERPWWPIQSPNKGRKQILCLGSDPHVAVLGGMSVLTWCLVVALWAVGCLHRPYKYLNSFKFFRFVPIILFHFLYCFFCIAVVI